MRTSERRQREVENMKGLILDAASQIFVENGYENTTLRKIAKTIEYNPATIYNYYKNKEEIFFALQERAFTNFYQAFDLIRQSDLKGYEKLITMGRRYIQFALENPHMYELMFIMKSPMNAAESLDPTWKIGEGNYNFLKEVIAECINENSIRISDVESGAFMIWSAVHGLASLIVMERTHMIPEDQLGSILDQAHTAFEHLLKKG